MVSLSFMDIIAVVALLVSILALVAAVYAIYQAARYIRSDTLIDVAREREPLERLMQSLDEQSSALRPDLFMAAFRANKSDDERKLEQEVQRIRAEFNALRTELARVPAPEGIRSHFGAERALVSLIKLRVRTEALTEDVAACRAKVDAARSTRFPRLR